MQKLFNFEYLEHYGYSNRNYENGPIKMDRFHNSHIGRLRRIT